MATDFRFIAGGTTYYLKPSGRAATPYTGSGTPWTGSTTTPFEVQMNDTTGGRFLTRPSIGQRLVGLGANLPTLTTTSIEYETQEWAVPFAIRASTRQNAIAAKQILMRALDNWAVGLPAQFYVHPDGVTNAVYFEILGAAWMDNERSWNEEHGRTLLRGTLTLLVREFGGRTAYAGDSIYAPVTYTNVTASNVAVLGTTGTGDLTAEGQPMNIGIVPSTTYARFLLASVQSVATQASGFSGTTVGTSYTSIGSTTLNIVEVLTYATMRVRLVMSVTFTSTGSTDLIDGVQAVLTLNGGATYHTVEFPSLSLAASASRRLLDFGDIPVPILPFSGHNTTTVSLGVQILAKKSSAVDTITGTIRYIELPLYYEYCTVSGVSIPSTDSVQISAYPVQTGRTSLPLPAPVAVRVNSTQSRGPGVIEGEMPKYRRGTSLWIAGTTTDEPGGTHASTDTFSVTVSQCPLFRAQRVD